METVYHIIFIDISYYYNYMIKQSSPYRYRKSPVVSRQPGSSYVSFVFLLSFTYYIAARYASAARW